MTSTEPTCAKVEADLSSRFDGEPVESVQADLDAHIRRCPSCAAFDRTLSATREALRFETLDAAPDVRYAVRERLGDSAGGLSGGPQQKPARGAPTEPSTPAPQRDHRRTRSIIRVAAVAAVAGLIVGAVVARSGLNSDGPRPAAAADLAERAVVVQHDVESLVLDFTLVESGWDPRVPERNYFGALRYQAPDRLSYELVDETTYPSGQWPANDVLQVLEPESQYLRSTSPCGQAVSTPASGSVPCTSAITREDLLVDAEPFDEAATVPLDLVTPVATLGGAADLESIGSRTIDGRPATGIELPAAEAQDLLAGLDPAGTLRPVHPADRVEVWLDDQSLAPLEMTVVAAEGESRAAWARGRGLDDEPGDSLLTLRATRVVVDGPVRLAQPALTADTNVRVHGFVDTTGRTTAGPTPTDLPDGLTLHAEGVTPTVTGEVTTRAWTDGRAWLTVRSTTDWGGQRLFGGLGDLVRPVPTADDGTAFIDGDGSHVAIHGDSADIVVAGSFPTDRLLAVAESLGVQARPVPDQWPESATASLAEAEAALPGLLVPPGPLPALRIDGGRVTGTTVDGAGHVVRLTQEPGDRLAPPLDTDDAVGVTVRGEAGRLSVGRSLIEWVEDGLVHSLRVDGRPPSVLLSVADSLLKP